MLKDACYYKSIELFVMDATYETAALCECRLALVIKLYSSRAAGN